jgi:hypothetical protein
MARGPGSGALPYQWPYELARTLDVAMPTRTSIMIGWMVLFGAAFALFLLVVLLAGLQRWRLRPGRRERAAARAEWTAHAAAVAERSEQAVARATAARSRAEGAEQAVTGAWQELERAQQEHDAAERAYQEAAARRGPAAPADPDGARAVTNAALAAYRRGDLSQDDLLKVWRWGSGWDPERERLERVLLQARAARREAHLRYRAVASAARAATGEAEVAEAEARALAEEAEVVAEELANLA